MKILMINDHIIFDGGAFNIFQFEKRIYEQDGNVVYTFSKAQQLSKDTTEKDYVVEESSNVIIRKFGKFIFNYKVYKELRKVIKEVKPDIINVHLVSKYPASIYLAIKGHKVIQTLHGSNLFCATSWGCLSSDSQDCELGIGLKCYLRKCVSLPICLLYKFLDFNTSSLIKKVVTVFRCPSRHIRETALSLGYRPAEYIPLPISGDFNLADTNFPPKPPVILFVGSMAVHKGVDVLLDAFRIVQKRLSSAKLVYAGEGEMLAELRQKADVMGISNDVDFLGFVDHEKINVLYQHAHVLAVPSVWKEQFGLVGPEALLSGVPCVGSNIGGIPEWLHDGEWGFLVPPRDKIALADKLCTILENEKLRTNFAKKGREFILKEYGVNKCRENVLRLINTTIEKV